MIKVALAVQNDAVRVCFIFCKISRENNCFCDSVKNLWYLMRFG